MGWGGAIAAGIVGGSAIGISIMTLPFVTPAFRRICIPYVPASSQQIKNVMQLLNRVEKPVDPVIDLGSGDGRVVLECAKRGISAIGVELNIPLVIYSKYSARRNNVSNYAKFYRRNILKTNLTAYRTAILFGAESMVEMLAPKLDEMNVNSHIIMCRFPMPCNTRWKLLEQEGEGIDSAWLYKKTDEIVKRNETFSS